MTGDAAGPASDRGQGTAGDGGPAVRVFLGRAGEVRRPADVAVLDDGERARADRFRGEELAAHYTASHAGVRRILGEWLGVAPHEVRFGRRTCPRCSSAEHGAPRVDWPSPAPHVSLSHTGPVWMLACAADRVVGADVEAARASEVDGLGRYVLSPAERAVVEAVDEDQRLHLLLRCWVRKEAVLKAVGVGIAAPMSSLEVAPTSVAPTPVEADLEFGRTNWWVATVLDGPRWYAAVAVAGDGPAPPEVTVTDLGSGTLDGG